MVDEKQHRVSSSQPVVRRSCQFTKTPNFAFAVICVSTISGCVRSSVRINTDISFIFSYEDKIDLGIVRVGAILLALVVDDVAAPGREGLFNLVKSIPLTLKYEPGTIVAGQSNNSFEFEGWVENQPSNPNSTISAGDTSGNLIVNRYGTFTANYKPLPPAIPPQYLAPLYGIIVSSIIGW